ncbi:MAG TPA: glycine--tRNA ligase [Candidatus Lokiarchaeia archaeon]|nr:glycine--tRNA ligase [Candidatus Lokiarchaeia archaeon]
MAESKKKPMLDVVMDLLMRRGFIAQTAEIYNNGLAGFFDFLPVGMQLKQNIEKAWREFFVWSSVDPLIFEIQGAVVLPEEVLIASGHVSSFSDPLVACKQCNAEVRADHLLESQVGMKTEGMTTQQIQAAIMDKDVKCPECGGDLAPVEDFNLMLKTEVGPSKNSKRAYLRPETAQSIFCDYKRVYQTMRAQLPFGICQIGPSYRNEISPRQGLIRMRGFTQMEIEFFFDPEEPTHPDYDAVKNTKINLITRDVQASEATADDSIEITIDEAMQQGIFPNNIQAYFVGKVFEFYQSLGIPFESMRFRNLLKEETPFYSMGNFDLEIKLDMGWKEAIGIAYRTDHDLLVHGEHSGAKLDADIQKSGQKLKKVVPHVVEPSFGVERALYCVLEHAYRPGIQKGAEKEKESDREWDWFQIQPHIAPFSAMVYPLMKKPELTEKAIALFSALKKEGIPVFYDQAGQIGRRYARADEIGTPFCFTVDYQTGEDGTVTIRDRDTMKQIRVPLEDCVPILKALVRREKKFLDFGEPI